LFFKDNLYLCVLNALTNIKLPRYKAGSICNAMAIDLEHLLENNRAWAKRVNAEDPQFFEKLSKIQTPEYLWIGCSDSRVPANQITGLLPGEVFVHRNVANVIVHTDLNCLSVIQYAVDVLKVKHIIVCGHYRCGGVYSALHGQKLGLIDNWLQHIQDVKDRFPQIFKKLNDEAKWDRLCELNVIAQVLNVAQTSIMQAAWARGQQVMIHGWIYSLKDGLLNNLNMTIKRQDEILERLDAAIDAVSGGKS
jgi:carbonic anhydrase